MAETEQDYPQLKRELKKLPKIETPENFTASLLARIQNDESKPKSNIIKAFFGKPKYMTSAAASIIILIAAISIYRYTTAPSVQSEFQSNQTGQIPQSEQIIPQERIPELVSADKKNLPPSVREKKTTVIETRTTELPQDKTITTEASNEPGTDKAQYSGSSAETQRNTSAVSKPKSVSIPETAISKADSLLDSLKSRFKDSINIKIPLIKRIR
jgi:hypothetical protein